MKTYRHTYITTNNTRHNFHTRKTQQEFNDARVLSAKMKMSSYNFAQVCLDMHILMIHVVIYGFIYHGSKQLFVG